MKKLCTGNGFYRQQLSGLIFYLGRYLSKTLLFILIGLPLSLQSQINLKDSTVQVIGYWSLDDYQLYNITETRIVLEGVDTVSIDSLQYDVEVTILDSTYLNYELEWYYGNVYFNSEDPLFDINAQVLDGLSVLFLVNRYGVLQEVINWKEIRSHVQKVHRVLHRLNKDETIRQLLEENETRYLTQEDIQTQTIKDAMQFHTFYGAKYDLTEPIHAVLQISNPYANDLIDATIDLKVDSLNIEEGSYALDMIQEIDSDQLTTANYNYLQKNQRTPDQGWEGFPKAIKKSVTKAGIHAGSGWIIYSTETITNASEGRTVIEIRDIRLL